MLQNRRGAYKFAPFRTIYTQIRKSAPQNLIFAYIVEDISVPCITYYTQFKDSPACNLAFAYKLDPFATDCTQSCGDVLQNRRAAYKSIPFRTDYTQIRKSTPQNLIFAYKMEGSSVPCIAFYTQFKDSPALKFCICV